MSDEHKAALAEGRSQGRAVRRYLEALEANKPKRGRKRTPESIQKRLDKIATELETADPLKRLQLTQEQIAQTYKFRLEAEEREAERKRIEAIGIKTFYAIVSDALTPALLTWRGIEATVELAHSSNSKIVIVGGGKDQLPLILGSDIAAVPPSTPLPQVPSAKEPALPDINALPPLFPNAASQTMPAPATPAPTTPAPTTP